MSAPAGGSYSDEDLLPISALQHLLFCERQFALIHVERLWSENRLTVEGRQLHTRADSGEHETRGAIRTTRALPLRSLHLGLTGIADVVEFHRDAATGLDRPFPIEYKRGRPKSGDEDRVQLCAQALCLEEMLGTEVPAGALFYGTTRRRTSVSFDPVLRRIVADAAARAHELFEAQRTPVARRAPKCEHCSLLELCLPSVTSQATSDYMRRTLDAALSSDGGES